MEIKDFRVVSDLVEFMPMSSLVELFNFDSNETVPFFKGTNYSVGKIYLDMHIVKFKVCFENGRIVYRIYV
jgi:hypothetical protein